MSPVTPIFFDIGDTLAVARFGDDQTLTGLDVFPFVAAVLAQLRGEGSGARRGLGVISNTPDGVTFDAMKRILAEADLLEHFEPRLLLFSSVEGLNKTQPEFFRLAAKRAHVPPELCIFVGEDPTERRVAQSAGFHVAFHPLHVFAVLHQLSGS